MQKRKLARIFVCCVHAIHKDAARIGRQAGREAQGDATAGVACMHACGQGCMKAENNVHVCINLHVCAWSHTMLPPPVHAASAPCELHVPQFQIRVRTPGRLVHMHARVDT
uniref:Uncharacterized protein n=1 Tax=Chlamydomonas euryale TaxID=1486919 RepID=A0A7R9V4E6_9CHLO